MNSLGLIDKWCTELGFKDKIEVNTLPVITHTFSHFKLLIEPALIACKNPSKLNIATENWVWYNEKKPAKVGLPAPIVQLIQSI